MIEMDYADGGTLAQLLAKRDQLMEERRILEMFSQMVAAIRYIHGHKILHRLVSKLYQNSLWYNDNLTCGFEKITPYSWPNIWVSLLPAYPFLHLILYYSSL